MNTKEFKEFNKYLKEIMQEFNIKEIEVESYVESTNIVKYILTK